MPRKGHGNHAIRCIHLLRLLEARGAQMPWYRLDELATMLGVSTRQIRRDLVAIAQSGEPVLITPRDEQVMAKVWFEQE